MGNFVRCVISFALLAVFRIDSVSRPHVCIVESEKKRQTIARPKTTSPHAPLATSLNTRRPKGRALEPRARAPQHVETFRINAADMSRMFDVVYGAELFHGRMGAIGQLR